MTSIALPRRDAVWSVVAWVALSAGGVANTAILFRFVGVSDYGIWATVTAFRAFLAFVDGGLAFGVARDAARVGTEADEAVRRIASARWISLGLGLGALLLAGAGASVPGALLGLSGPALDRTRALALLVGLEVGIAVAAGPFTAMIRGRSRFDVLARVALLQLAMQVGLILSLVDRLGLIGAAVAVAVARVVAAGASYAWVRARERPLLALATDRGTARDILRFAAPVWVLGAAAQLGLGTDVPIVGGFHGPASAAQYDIGKTVPAVAVGLLYVVIDTAYPRLSRAFPDEATLVTRRLLSLGMGLGGLGFTVLIALGVPLLTVYVGIAAPLSVAVLILYSIAWLVNVPAHVLVLGAIARGQHRLLAPIVVVEALVSFALSVALAVAIGPIGPAVGTLVPLTISNLLVVPALLLPRLGLRWLDVARACGLGLAIGVLAGATVAALAFPLRGQPVIALGVAALLTALIGVGPVWRLLQDAELRARILAVALHGGWWVFLRERSERRRATATLAAVRREQPVVWIASAPPLVSVRIATYNRGRLVAERAIASALAQTHRQLEVVVVGDHCDAATEAAVRSVRDRRVRFENLSQRGDYPRDPIRRWMVAGVAPMNRALDLATGAWIAPLDDDDEFTPDHVEVLLDACRSRGLEFAYGIADAEMQPGVWEKVGSWPPRQGRIVHASVLYEARLRIFRHAIDSWRLHEPADWNLWRRMRDAGVRMGFVDRVVSRHYLEARETRG